MYKTLVKASCRRSARHDMTYLNMSGLVSGFVEVCRGLSGFVDCRAWGLHDALCVCAHMCLCLCLSGFVEVCRGLSSLGAT